MIIKYTNLSLRESLSKFFHFVNAAQLDSSKLLTETEIQVLIEFILLPEKFKYQRFSTLAKRKVRELLKNNFNWVLSKENLNNKIYAMIDKNILSRDEDGVIHLVKHLRVPIESLINAVTNKERYDIIFRYEIS